MGYHVSIIRKRGKEIKPISKKEWEEFVCKSSLLSFEKLQDGRMYAVFKEKDQIRAWLDWRDGEIWTKNPDDEIIAKMITIADQLKARVRGDEGEYYRTANESYYDPLEEEERAKVKKETYNLIRRTRLKNFLLNGAIFGFFFLLVLIVRSCSR